MLANCKHKHRWCVSQDISRGKDICGFKDSQESFSTENAINNVVKRISDFYVIFLYKSLAMF